MFLINFFPLLANKPKWSRMEIDHPKSDRRNRRSRSQGRRFSPNRREGKRAGDRFRPESRRSDGMGENSFERRCFKYFLIVIICSFCILLNCFIFVNSVGPDSQNWRENMLPQNTAVPVGNTEVPRSASAASGTFIGGRGARGRGGIRGSLRGRGGRGRGGVRDTMSPPFQGKSNIIILFILFVYVKKHVIYILIVPN